MRPTATSASDTIASLLSAWGVSFLGGGKPARAIVADVHPLHQPAHPSRRLFQVSESSRRRPTARMTAHAAAQPTLYRRGSEDQNAPRGDLTDQDAAHHEYVHADEADFPADIPQWRRCHASISSRQDVLDGNGQQLHEQVSHNATIAERVSPKPSRTIHYARQQRNAQTASH
jgi:hypothetical protein